MATVSNSVTFFFERSMLCAPIHMPIDSWDPEKAVEMARHIKESCGVLPQSFHFTAHEYTRRWLFLPGDVKETRSAEFDILGVH